MTEYEEKDGKLVEVKPPCDHEWGDWFKFDHTARETRLCFKCDERQILIPKGYDETDNWEVQPVHVDFVHMFAQGLAVIFIVSVVVFVFPVVVFVFRGIAEVL